MRYHTLDTILLFLIMIIATVAMVTYLITWEHEYYQLIMLFGFWPVFAIRMFLEAWHEARLWRQQGDDDAGSDPD